MSAIQKEKCRKAVVSLIAVVCFTVGSVLMPYTATANEVLAAGEERAPQRVITVSGQGTVKVSPDVAYITLGTVTEDKDAKTAQTRNAQIMEKVVNAIIASGVSKDDIKTVNYGILPKYSYPEPIPGSGEKSREPQIVGYTVNNSIQVTVRDTKKTGSIIDIAAAQGANASNNISFGVSDYDKQYNEALRLAVGNAAAKAKIIAESLGLSIGVPASISESGGLYYPPVWTGYDSAYVKGMGSAEATPIHPGTLEVKANVTITYNY